MEKKYFMSIESEYGNAYQKKTQTENNKVPLSYMKYGQKNNQMCFVNGAPLSREFDIADPLIYSRTVELFPRE